MANDPWQDVRFVARDGEWQLGVQREGKCGYDCADPLCICFSIQRYLCVISTSQKRMTCWVRRPHCVIARLPQRASSLFAFDDDWPAKASPVLFATADHHLPSFVDVATHPSPTNCTGCCGRRPLFYHVYVTSYSQT